MAGTGRIHVAEPRRRVDAVVDHAGRRPTSSPAVGREPAQWVLVSLGAFFVVAGLLAVRASFSSWWA
jgi:hypothetical protein